VGLQLRRRHAGRRRRRGHPRPDHPAHDRHRGQRRLPQRRRGALLQRHQLLNALRGRRGRPGEVPESLVDPHPDPRPALRHRRGRDQRRVRFRLGPLRGLRHGRCGRGRGRRRSGGPDGGLRRFAHQWPVSAERELHRPVVQHADELALDLRRRRHRHRPEPVPHLHRRGYLHRHADRDQRRGQRRRDQDELHFRDGARSPRRGLQRRADQRRLPPRRRLHRRIHRITRELELGLRRRRHEFPPEPEPHLHDGRQLHGHPDRDEPIRFGRRGQDRPHHRHRARASRPT